MAEAKIGGLEGHLVEFASIRDVCGAGDLALILFCGFFGLAFRFLPPFLLQFFEPGHVGCVLIAPTALLQV